MRTPWLCLPFCAAALVMLAGCGTEPDRNSGPSGLQPPNDTPQNAVLRLVAAYEQEKPAEYAALLTGDFRFRFSTFTDPDAAMDYPGGWAKADEDTSARHLFFGGTNAMGAEMRGASSIEVTLTSTTPIGDGEGGRDTTKYKVLVTRVDMLLVVPPGPDQTDDTRYLVQNNSHRFFLVRGDAATGLEASQPADSAHWYVWNWVDETAPVPVAPARTGRSALTPAAGMTWGGIKLAYRWLPPPALPRNTTPQGAIQRLVAAYEGKLGAQYAAVFTGDFTWEFSAAVDPVLAQKYAGGWFKTDETASARHLFEGFSSESGFLPGASSIELTLASSSPVDDAQSPDPARYKVLATSVDALIVVPAPPGGIEETRYVITGNYHRFFLVRGDAALGLGPDQPADAARWYVYRWVDETTGVAAPSRAGRALPTRVPPMTLGRVKGLYR